MRNIVLLISGAGSNMQAIVRVSQQDNWPILYGARIAAVISNRADAAGLLFAEQCGIATHVISHKQHATREQFDQALAASCATYDSESSPVLVVLAGFMRILTPVFITCFSGRILNIHPSLLPAFAGMNTHQRAIDAGCKFAGASVHWVTEQLDAGPILDQIIVPILPTDDAHTLGTRVLGQEHLLYPRAIARALLYK
jgi:phosphoribosylglycinamide formyltransferase 1